MLPSRLIAALAAATVVAGLSVQEYAARTWGGGPMGFDTMLFAQAIGAIWWLALTPTVIAPLVRRVPLNTDRRGRNLGIHFGAALALATIHTLAVAVPFAMYYFGWSPLAIRDVFRDRMHTGFAWSASLYLLIAGLIQSWRGRAAASAVSPEATLQPPVDSASPEPEERFLRRILVRTDGKIGVVPVDRVDWIEAADNNVVVHAGSSAHTVRATLSGLSERLDPSRFVRVHRSAVVNVERVREVQPWFHGELVLLLDDATRLTIGRTYRERFLSVLEG